MSEIVLTPIDPGDDADADVLMANFNTIKSAVVGVSEYVDGEISTFETTLENVQSTMSDKAYFYVPTGTVIYYAKNDVPNGYLYCNGSAVSRTDYADLFAVIGTTYGAGDGSTTFNLPYLIGRFIECGTPGYYLEPGLPNITGTIANNGLSHSGWAQGAFSADNSRGVKSNRGDAEDGGYYNFNAGWSNGIYGNSSTVQPEALCMLPCIKY